MGVICAPDLPLIIRPTDRMLVRLVARITPHGSQDLEELGALLTWLPGQIEVR